MTPSTVVRALRPASRGPFTFIGLSSFFLEKENPPLAPPRRGSGITHRCVAHEDDGTPCGLAARYVDMKLGGHVCYNHRLERKQEALQLV